MKYPKFAVISGLCLAATSVNAQRQADDLANITVPYLAFKYGECPEAGSAQIHSCNGVRIKNTQDLVLTAGHCVIEHAFNGDAAMADKRVPSGEIYAFKSANARNAVWPSAKLDDAGNYRCISKSEVEALQADIAGSPDAVRAANANAVLELSNPEHGAISYTNDFASFTAGGLPQQALSIAAAGTKLSGKEIIGVGLGLANCSKTDSTLGKTIFDFFGRKDGDKFGLRPYQGSVVDQDFAQKTGLLAGKHLDFYTFTTDALEFGILDVSDSEGPYRCFGDSGSPSMIRDAAGELVLAGIWVGGWPLSWAAHLTCDASGCQFPAVSDLDTQGFYVSTNLQQKFFCGFARKIQPSEPYLAGLPQCAE